MSNIQMEMNMRFVCLKDKDISKIFLNESEYSQYVNSLRDGQRDAPIKYMNIPVEISADRSFLSDK